MSQLKTEDNYLEIDLLRLLQSLWKRAWAIVLAALVCGGIALGYTSFLVTPLYKASALLYVNNSSITVGSTQLSISPSELSAAQSLVDTYLVILKTRTTLNKVIEKAELSYTYKDLSGMISAAAVNSTEIFEIVVTSPDPQEAEKIANTIAQVLPERISAIVDGSSVRIVDYAIVPSVKASPSITKNTAIGMIIGFVLACGVVILMDLFDDQIHDSDYLMQNYDIPVLAVIPELLSSSKSSSYYYKKNYYAKPTEEKEGK